MFRQLGTFRYVWVTEYNTKRWEAKPAVQSNVALKDFRKCGLVSISEASCVRENRRHCNGCEMHIRHIARYCLVAVWAL